MGLHLKGCFCLAILAVSYQFSAVGEPLSQSSQGQKLEEEATSKFTVKVPVEVVVVHATVTDKKGRPVKDLTADDFKVYEDGKIQRIQSFAVESDRPPRPAHRTSPQVKSAASPIPEPTPSAPPRLLSLFLDDLTSPSFADVYRSIESIKSFVTEGLGEQDQVSILTASGRFQLPFTRDREALLEGVSQLHKRINRQAVSRSDCPKLTDLQADRIRNGSSNHPDFRVAVEEAIGCMGIPEAQQEAVESLVYAAALHQHEATQQRNRNLLKALRRHVQLLSYFEARKALILFSDGFLSLRLRHELEELMDLSLRSGVVFSTVDVRGLYTTDLRASVRGPVGVEGAAYLLNEKLRLREDDMMEQKGPLAELAHATGGTFFHNNNDLSAGLRRIAESQSFYYVLTYGLTESKLDGRYHKIKVKVSRPGVEIRHRKGYFAPKEKLSLETLKQRDIENDLEAVLYGPGNLRGVPIELSYSYFRLDEMTYQLSLRARIDIRGLSFLRENGHRENLIHLVIAVLDDDGRYLKGSRRKVNLKLTESSYAALLNYGLRTQVNLQLPQGHYRIKAVARDSVDTRLGSTESTLEIPPVGDLSVVGGDSSGANAADEAALTRQASLDLGLSYFFDASDLARIPLSAKLEVGDFQPNPSRGDTRLHFVGAAYAEDKSVAALFSETLDRARDHRDVDYRNTLKLRPGKYRFELVVSDEWGILGVARRDLVVPAMTPDGLASSSLVVSQQFLHLPEQIRNLERSLVNEKDPLVYKDFKVLAPAEPQIRLDRPLAVFYKLYNLAEAANTGKLKGRVQLINERGEANRFPAVDLDRSLERTAKGEASVFLAFKLPAEELAPGKYRLVVETTESSTGRMVTGETGVLLQ